MADMDIDFSDVKDIRIPQGQVKYIEKYEDGVAGPLYWKRPFQYPVLGGCFRAFFSTPNGTKVRVYNLPWGLYDYYGMTKLLGLSPTSTNSDGSINVYYKEPVIWLPTEDDTVNENDYSSTLTWIKLGLQQNGLSLVTYYVRDENQAEVFPPKSGIVKGGICTLVSLRKDISGASFPITLYAIPSADSLSDSTWALGKLVKSDLYQDWEYQLIEHETDIEVPNSGSSFVKIAYQGSGVNSITDARSDFDYFKTEYDIVTGGKFPKSIYPYLIGAARLKFYYSSSSLGKSEIYLAFKVKR